MRIDKAAKMFDGEGVVGRASVIVYLGLGSSLGDRAAYCEFAVRRLGETPGITVLRRSNVRETAPVGGVAKNPFLNAAVEIETTRTCRELLEACAAIETETGRSRERHYDDRTLDIDILLFGDAVVREPGLVVPHPRLTNRVFMLEPLADLAPDRVIPGRGETVAECLARLLAAQNKTPGALPGAS